MTYGKLNAAVERARRQWTAQTMDRRGDAISAAAQVLRDELDQRALLRPHHDQPATRVT